MNVYFSVTLIFVKTRIVHFVENISTIPEENSVLTFRKIMHSVSNAKKSRRDVKKTTKRRESSDHRSEITIADIEQTASETDTGYVYMCAKVFGFC